MKRANFGQWSLFKLLPFIILLCLNSLGYADWTVFSPPFPDAGGLADIHFTSTSEGWAVGYRSRQGGADVKGILLHYLNGSWISVTPPNVGSPWGLDGVHFTSPNEGWAVGFSKSTGCLLHFSNGQWKFVDPPYGSGALNAVHFTSPDEGWAVGNKGSEGIILHYLKGSWTLVSPPQVSSEWYLEHVHFSSPNEGWAVGLDAANKRGVLLHYLNDNWTTANPSNVSSYWALMGVHFTSTNNGWAVGTDDTNKKAVLLHFLNGSWTSVIPPDLTGSWFLEGLHFTSPNRGWAVGIEETDAQIPLARGVLLKYSSGSWTSVVTPDLGLVNQVVFSRVYFTSAIEGWVVGEAGYTAGGVSYGSWPVLLRYFSYEIETISTPNVPSGQPSGTVGSKYLCSSGGSTSSFDDSIEYRFDWGDGTYSDWLPVGQNNASKSWSASGTYSVKAQARCAIDASIVSDWSAGLTVTITSGDAGTINLPQTGQTKCYDSLGTEINCAGTGQDGEIRAGIEWPDPRFTNPDGTTPVTGDMVLDRLTGLIWARDAGTPTLESCSGGVKTWHQALACIACLNTSNYLGHTDWRLPNVNELRSLRNVGEANSVSWLTSQGFNNIIDGLYWSSTTISEISGTAWGVAFGGVDAVFGFPKATKLLVWPVRGGKQGNSDSNYPANVWKTGQTASYYAGDDGDLQAGVAWPSPRFTNPDGTTPITCEIVIDQLTGLMWAKDAGTPTVAACVGGKRTWQEALDYVKCLNTNSFLGYTDWRVPNVKELSSLLDYSKPQIALPSGHPFENIYHVGIYWSSTTCISDTDYSFYVDMVTADELSAYKFHRYSVWPLRDGVVLEYISTPDLPIGSNTGFISTSYSYSTGGSTSSYGHTVEYQFDWKGDGSDLSSWGSSTQSKSWTAAGTYNVSARARCSFDTSVISGWSKTLSVGISVFETISTPKILSGPATGSTGISYSYTTGGSSSSLSTPIEYRFDWGDGTHSDWSSSTSATKTWTSPGIYLVKAQAQAPRSPHNFIISEWSEPLQVTITLVGPDLTGSWTTPLTQTCRTIGKNQRCWLRGIFTVSNIGNRDASSTYVNIYLSDNSTYKDEDTPLRSFITGKLKAGKNKLIRFNYNLPVGQNATGKYIVTVIDKDNLVAEVDENNNAIAYGPIL